MTADYPLISVIIPIYNVERYLRRCLDSVLSQTYKNLEVFLVDDGSPDRCPEICDEYANRDNRVIVIHKNNGGLSSARNAALDSPIRGDYVTFVDSDDWIENDYYEYCMKVLQETQADVVQIDYSLATDIKIEKRQPKVVKVNIYDGKEILQYHMNVTTSSFGGYSVWRCLFSRHLIGLNRFRDGKINEDIDWKYKILRSANRLAVSNRVMYYYYQSGKSISDGGLKKRDFELREAADLLAQMTAEETYGNIAFLGKVKQARTSFSLLSKIAYFGIADQSINKKETVKELTKEHRRNVTTLIKAPLPISRKILAVMFAVNYSLTEAVIHIAKKHKQ